MSDLDIGIPFSDTSSSEPGRHRRRRRRRGRTGVALTVVLAIFGGLVLSGWWGYGQIRDYLATPDYAGTGSGEVVVAIKAGDTATDIGNTLYKADVVKSAKAFVEAAQADPDSQGLQPGSYAVKKRMAAREALLLLLTPESKIFKRFTVPEGKSVIQTLAIISKATAIPLADLQKAAKDPAALGVPTWARADPSRPLVLEGFLFPNTYDVQPDDTPVTILTAMVRQTVDVMAQVEFGGRASQLNLSQYEALTVASLVEGEGIPSDFGKIARVVYNRVAEAMPLEFDSTTNYGRELKGQPRKPSGKFSAAELRDPANPYRTHGRQGLPPGPIANPGKAALDAAVTPPGGPWLFFVRIDKQGNYAFAVTLAEHEANIARSRANGAFE